MTQPIPNPRVLVDPPALSPPRYGLFAVAQVVTGDGGPDHWQHGGVEWQTDACATGGVWAPACPAPVPVTITVTFTATPSDVDGMAVVAAQATATPADPPRLVAVTVSRDSAVIATGDPAVPVATVRLDPDGATSVPVSAADIGTGGDADGMLELDATGAGTVTVTIDAAEAATKGIPSGIALAEGGDPFTVYAGVRCSALGIGDAEARARRRLAFVEQRVAERYIWQTQITQGATDLTPGGAVSLIRGIALLEQALAEGYAGTGVIHAPRWVAGYAEKADQLRHDGPLLRTVLDTPYAFGLGYDTPATADVGQPVRLYATGVPVIYRSDVFVPATGAEALDRVTNEMTVIAERTYAAAFDCGHWSVLVDVAALEA